MLLSVLILNAEFYSKEICPFFFFFQLFFKNFFVT